MLEDFHTVASQLTYHRPRIPIISNVSGKQMPESEYGTAEYWVRQVREPVRFLDSMRWLECEGVRSFPGAWASRVLCWQMPTACR